MDGHAPAPCKPGFTLVELLTVLGLVALLVALFLPVIARARAAAASAACLAHLRQIGTAWTMSAAEEHGRLPEIQWYTPDSPEISWNGYWTGTMDRYKVTGRTLFCPAAPEPTPSDATRGYGSAAEAWTGRYSGPGTGIFLNPKTYRESSYGYNRWIADRGGSGPGGNASFLSDIKDRDKVPVFVDCAYADAKPVNGSPAAPVKSPPDLTGRHAAPGQPEHWKLILARHGRGVNVYRADGSAAWTRLDELYLLTWKAGWTPYRLALPSD